MVAATLRYRRMVCVGLASNAINLSTSEAMGHRVQVPMAIADLNSFFVWSREVGSSRAVGHFNPAGAGNGAPTFLMALGTSFGIDYTDLDGKVSALSYASSALDMAEDARLRPGGYNTVNDLVMSYILFKCFGTSSFKTADSVYNLEDAQNMITNFGVASAIQSSLEESDASGAGSEIDIMFTNLIAADPKRFFDASGRQMAGLFETNADISGSGTWNIVEKDVIEIPMTITFNAPVTLNSVTDDDGELSGNKAKTLIIPSGESFSVRLQLLASRSVDSSSGVVIDPTTKPVQNDVVEGSVASSWITTGVTSRGIAQNTDTGEIFFLDNPNASSIGSIYKIILDNNGNISGTVLVAGGHVANHIDGLGQAAALYGPTVITYGGNNLFYIAGGSERCIRVFDSSTNVVSTLAGNSWNAGKRDGTGVNALFSLIHAITMGSDGNLYVSDSGNGCLRRVTPAGVVTTVAGNIASPTGLATDGTGSAASFTYQMGGCAGDSSGNIYICDNNTIRRFRIATGLVKTLFNESGAHGNTDGAGAAATFYFNGQGGVNGGGGLWMDKVNNKLWAADAGNGSIRLVDLNSMTVVTVVTAAEIDNAITSNYVQPTSILVTSAGNVLINLSSHLPNPSIACLTFTSPAY